MDKELHCTLSLVVQLLDVHVKTQSSTSEHEILKARGVAS